MGPKSDYDESRNRGFKEKKILSVLKYKDSVRTSWLISRNQNSRNHKLTIHMLTYYCSDYIVTICIAVVYPCTTTYM